MDTNLYIVICAAILPAVMLVVMIWWKDKYQREKRKDICVVYIETRLRAEGAYNVGLELCPRHQLSAGARSRWFTHQSRHSPLRHCRQGAHPLCWRQSHWTAPSWIQQRDYRSYPRCLPHYLCARCSEGRYSRGTNEVSRLEGGGIYLLVH